MAVVVILAHTNDNGAHIILQRIHELERKSAIKLSLSKRIFLAELNTVEQLMSILSRSETEIKILKQTEEDNLIERHVIIISKRTNDKLVYAKSYIFSENLPPRIVDKIKRKDQGLGNIIASSELETFRRLLRIGYEPKTRAVFRIYEILCKKKVAMEIKETFMLK
jgi:chorismate-pyruvate lyase